MKYGTPFDKNNPPARMFWDGGHPSLGGYALDAERQWAETAKARHEKDPTRYLRPAFIVKLKEWKPQK